MRKQAAPLIRGVQLDGWWMEQLALWPDPTLFPSGWESFIQNLSQAVAGQPSAFSSSTPLAPPPLLLYKAFFAEDYDLFAALQIQPQQSPQGCYYPAAADAERFFTALFQQGQALGMTAYETDFMSDHLLPTPGLAGSVDGLPLYLGGLDRAGAALAIPMQWCMPTAGIVLFAANLSAVTNLRASVDYACEGPLNFSTTWAPNYMTMIPSLLFWAADVAPSKDIFLTHSQQPGGAPSCGSTDFHAQPNVELDAILAVLSTGPVGIGDGAGYTNITLLNSTCAADGLILKPDKPITALDSVFVPASPGQPHGYVGFLPLTPEGDCSLQRPCSPVAGQSHSQLLVANLDAGVSSGSNQTATWHWFASVHVGAPFALTAVDVYPQLQPGALLWYREWRWSPCRSGVAVTAQPSCLRQLTVPVNATEPLFDLSSGPSRVDAEGAIAYQLYHVFPVLAGDWILLGELSKIVPVSSRRFTAVRVGGSGRSSGVGAENCLDVKLQATPSETVTLAAIDPSGVYRESPFLGSACNVGSEAWCSICA